MKGLVSFFLVFLVLLSPRCSVFGAFICRIKDASWSSWENFLAQGLPGFRSLQLAPISPSIGCRAVPCLGKLG